MGRGDEAGCLRAQRPAEGRALSHITGAVVVSLLPKILGLLEHLRGRYAQDRRKFKNRLETGRIQSALEQRDVVALEVGVQGKLFLREPRLSAKPPEHFSESDLWLQPFFPVRRQGTVGGAELPVFPIYW